jgi:UDP-N-acetylmuramoylalanine--D-glutamate ligase
MCMQASVCALVERASLVEVQLVTNFDGRRVTVIGLAREGTALVNFLAQRGAVATASDLKNAEELGENICEIRSRWPESPAPQARARVCLELGGHPLTILDDAEIVFVSPGVPAEAPVLAEARRRGILLSSESRLFATLCPAPIIGVTGSSGKTTTATLVGLMLEAAGRRTWVGGNIGRPLIGHLDDITPDDWVVMELSSFQLEYFAPASLEKHGPAKGDDPLLMTLRKGFSPPFAAILNISPNHLDRHPSMEAYIAAKVPIVASQGADRVALLGYDNAITRSLAEACPGQICYFSLETEVHQGTFLRGDRIVLRWGEGEESVCPVSEVRLRGQHNLANVLAACALGGAAGVPTRAMAEVARTFAGVEHRLELVRELRGARYYNDSIATSPERLVAALRSFDEPIVLLAGGRDKHLPWDEAAALMLEKARHIILFGEAAPLIDRAIAEAKKEGSVGPVIHYCHTLEEAVKMAAGCAQPGDVVLLSPGGTSFDAFQDFAHRGRRFKELVQAL